MIAMGYGVSGDRVIQASDAEQNAIKVNADTFNADDSGIILTPEHVHQNLRQLFNQQSSAAVQQFRLDSPSLNLFSPS